MVNVLYGMTAAEVAVAYAAMGVSLAGGGTGNTLAVPSSPGSLTVWDTFTSGTQVTTLRNVADSSNQTTVTPDADGRIGFREVSGTGRTLYLDAGTGSRYPIQPADMGSRLVALLLADLADVAATTPTNGQVLTYSTGSSSWGPGAGGSTGTLDDLTNVTAPTPSNGQILQYASGTTDWRPVTNTLDNLSNVTAPTPADGDGIYWNAGANAWQTGPASGATIAASAVTSGTFDLARVAIGSVIFVDKAKGMFGAAAGNWPATRPTARTDVRVDWCGDTDPGTRAIAGDNWFRE